MIHISRDRTDPAGRPIRPDDTWFDLSARWTEEAKKEGSEHSVGDHVYRHESVKMALEKLFHFKCAYCEARLGVDWQVEHFRPKGNVAERPDHPGYYWLAYTWENLYPSCASCNQKRQDKPLWDDPVTGASEGKADQFPVEDEAHRAMGPRDDLTLERPFLLDPCGDDPEAAFVYTTLGEIVPALGNRRAQESIRVFHLTQRRLRDQRKEQIDAVIVVLKLIRHLRQTDDPARVTQLEGEVEANFFSDSSLFAGAARFVRNDPDAFGV